MKKIISGVLSLLLAVIAVAGIHVPVLAEETQSTTATRGVYWFSPQEHETDLTDTYIYDDALLRGDSLAYNKQLATMSYELAVTSISSLREPRTDEGYANKSRNLRAYLEDNGFIDFDTNEFYKQKPTTASMGAACAHKTIVDGGREYTLLAIVPRSAGYEAEWAGNFMLGQAGDHEGFKLGKDLVLAFAKAYVEQYGITGDIKVWTAGYSRGAGITNQVAAALISDPKAALGESINLTPDNLYCYTFGTPNSAQTPEGEYGPYNDPAFDYIHNTWEPYDIVTIAPPKQFGFDRYGTYTGYASPENKERMLSFLSVTSEATYNAYIAKDPDNFTPYKVDLDALLQKKLNFVPDDESYLPKTQAEFFALLEESIVEAVRQDDKTGASDPRTTFYNTYQEPLARLLGYFLSHLEKSSAIINGIRNSKYAIPLVITMYLTYLAEIHRNTAYNAEEIEKLFNELSEYIGAEDGTVPQEIREQFDALEDVKAAADSFDDFVDIARTITGTLYVQVMGEGLSAAGVNVDDPDLYAQMTNVETDGIPISRFFSYLLLYDTEQTPGVSFDALNQQFKHFATLVGNAGSYMRTHFNEVILGWLRAQDSSYDDFVKEDAPRKAGYRRAYIPQPEGVTVSGIVKDESGNVAAEFTNGEITSRTDPWIGITTSDGGNWLRLPVDKTYYIELKTDKETSLDLMVTEYDIYSHTEVRRETSDADNDWTDLKVKPSDKITWVISAVTDSEYTLPSAAAYYIEITRTFKIAYDLNGGTLNGQTGIIEETYEENTAIELPAPVREGYGFDYWEGSKYQAGDTYIVTEDHTFTAKWKENGKPAPDPAGGAGSGENAKTGDTNHILPWLILLMSSLCVFLTVVSVRLRKKNR